MIKTRYYGALGLSDASIKRQVRLVNDLINPVNAILATKLVLGTMYVESDFGYSKDGYVKNGISITQIDKISFMDVQKRIARSKVVNILIMNLGIDVRTIKYRAIEHNLLLSIIFTRLHYYLRCGALDEYPIEKMWKIYYNSILGDGTEEDFLLKYQKYN